MRNIKSFILLLLVTVLCGCQTNVEVVPEYNAGNDGLDMGGLVITASRDDNNFEETYLGYKIGTENHDFAAKRVADVEKKYNCSIEFIVDPEFGSKIAALTASGTAYVDFAIMTRYNPVLSRSGMLTPMSLLENYIDYRDSDKWGTPNTFTQLAWDGELYGVIPVTWPEYYFTIVDFPVISNTDMILSAGHTDPREFVENGEWTREKLEEVVTSYYHKEGDDVHYGISMFKPHFYDMALRASGVRMAVKQNGRWVSGIHSEAGREALQWASDFCTVTCKDVINNSDNSTKPALDAFCSGKSSLLIMHSNYAFASNSQYDNVVAYEIENFGVLPFPLGPGMEYGHWVGQYERTPNVLFFPLIANNTEPAAIVANDIFEPFDAYPDHNALSSYYSNSVFFDERDTAVLMEMLRNCDYNFLEEGMRYITEQCANGYTNITQILEENKDKYQNLVDRFVSNHYDSLEKIFGEDYLE